MRSRAKRRIKEIAPIDIEAFSALIEKYCPPVQEYDPEHPAYT